MNDPAKSGAPRLPRVSLALAGALLVASVVALAIQETGACGGCQVRDGAWKFVAPAGIAGYAVLLVFGFLSPQHLFPIGAAIAAAVHTVLVVAMLVLGKVCFICVSAAALALALFVILLIRSNARVKIVACVYVPAVLVASGPTAWALAQEETRENERQAFIQAVHGSGSSRDAALTIQVFEQDHCSYCRDFRELYLPRLERDFGGRVHVRFLPATATRWVQRTPTIVIEGGPVYEGLPETYSELRVAVERAMSSGK